jgi:Family of unknown function (DUF6152)
MRAPRLLAVAIFVVAFTMLAGLVSAHHSVVGYDRKQTVTLKGVVSEWRWRNPHAFLLFEVKDASGKVVTWSGELQSPLSMVALGLNRNTFKAGDEVTVVAFPAVKGTPDSIVQKIMGPDGKVIIDRGSRALEP